MHHQGVAVQITGAVAVGGSAIRVVVAAKSNGHGCLWSTTINLLHGCGHGCRRRQRFKLLVGGSNSSDLITESPSSKGPDRLIMQSCPIWSHDDHAWLHVHLFQVLTLVEELLATSVIIPPQPLPTQATSVSTTPPLPPPPVPSADDSQSQTGTKSLPPPPPNTLGDKKGAKRASLIRLVLRVPEEPTQDLHQPPIKQIKQIKPRTSRRLGMNLLQWFNGDPLGSSDIYISKTPNPAQKSQGLAPKQKKKKWPGWAVIESNGKEARSSASTNDADISEHSDTVDHTAPLNAPSGLLGCVKEETTAKLQELQDQVLNQDTRTEHCLEASLHTLCAFGTTESRFTMLTQSMATYTTARGTLPRPEISFCSQPGSGAIMLTKDLAPLALVLSPPPVYKEVASTLG
ncbi:hypothetical protein B0H13DRAFT_2400963 [Mycena leptocephala]|nr:hypothetical protein B0H13DRAFT_2400963 [Mycena leptocephala]